MAGLCEMGRHEMMDLSEFEMEEAHGGATCHGVTVLAWARDAGVAPTESNSAPYQGRRSSGGYVPT
jgi:hypothetical protein